MTDQQPPRPGLPVRAADRLTDVTRVVRAASEDVAAVGRGLRRVVHAARRPGGPLAMLEKLTRTAPLPMLGIAFFVGVLIASDRRRR